MTHGAVKMKGTVVGKDEKPSLDDKMTTVRASYSYQSEPTAGVKAGNSDAKEIKAQNLFWNKN